MQHRVLKNGEVAWRCLGRNCGALIKTDSNITSVRVCNEKHSGEHPVTMSSPSSPAVQLATAASLESLTPACTAPASPASLAPATFCARSTPIADRPLFNQPLPQHRWTVTEINRLKQEIATLRIEYEQLPNHTIEPDTRLLQYTDEIFVMNTLPRVQCELLLCPVPTHADCSVQCILPAQPTAPMTDRVTQCDPLLSPSTACRDPSRADYRNLITNLKTTIEILYAELERCRNVWRKLKGWGNKPSNTRQLRFKVIDIAGNSYVRHLAGLVQRRIAAKSRLRRGVINKPSGQSISPITPRQTDHHQQLCFLGTLRTSKGPN
ncbi:hypothetical protein J6590_072535 [Homalodisca vitripennis]|nr:hypothetical protein J6590_072535 [Homalodisca vitripennis]